MAPASEYRRRRYDDQPACADILAQLQDIPQQEIRDFCAGILLHFADRYRKDRQLQDKKSHELHSIGVEGLSSLYRFGSERRRWYDDEPKVQRAVGNLYSLPPEGLSWLGQALGDTIGLLKIYGLVCEDVNQPVLQGNLTRICTTSLQTGADDARDLLVSMVGEERYKQALLE